MIFSHHLLGGRIEKKKEGKIMCLVTEGEQNFEREQIDRNRY